MPPWDGPRGDQNQPQILSTQPCQGERQRGEQAGVHSAGLQLVGGMQGGMQEGRAGCRVG